MLMSIKCNSTLMSKEDQDLLLEQVLESSIDEGESFDQYIYLQLMNFYIVEKLIESHNFKVNFKICGMDLKNYEYIFYKFLDQIPDIYSSVNKNENFDIIMVGDGFEIFFRVFIYDDNFIINAYDFSGKDVGFDEVITKSEFIKIIESVKGRYVLLINNVFDDRFEKYLSNFKVLDFN